MHLMSASLLLPNREFLLWAGAFCLSCLGSLQAAIHEASRGPKPGKPSNVSYWLIMSVVFGAGGIGLTFFAIWEIVSALQRLQG